ncbi:MAG TPA: hypothetical protein VMW50_07960 [Dehalococcoidia bacterium]|nr:hypothetical protein [Dehalococcoidia bacterium]
MKKVHRSAKSRTRVGFLHGFFTAFDLKGGRFISIDDLRNGPARDRRALAGDWAMVGGDLKKAMEADACGQD